MAVLIIISSPSFIYSLFLMEQVLLCSASAWMDFSEWCLQFISQTFNLAKDPSVPCFATEGSRMKGGRGVWRSKRNRGGHLTFRIKLFVKALHPLLHKSLNAVAVRLFKAGIHYLIRLCTTLFSLRPWKRETTLTRLRAAKRRVAEGRGGISKIFSIVNLSLGLCFVTTP